MAKNSIFKSIDYVSSESTKMRLPCAYKRFATDGKTIPFKKNWQESWCSLPTHFEKILDQILNYEVREDDVFVVTYMKSGTTWMQECIWLLLNNLDFEKSKEESVMIRSLYLDFLGLMPDGWNTIEMSKLYANPRILKTHLPANLVPLQIWERKLKTVYVARNIKDVIVSSFHFNKSTNLWQGNTLAEYVEDFINSEILYTHYWSHVVDFWQMRHVPFIFFITYEEMKSDLAGVLQKLCTFLERPPLTQAELEKTVEFLTFDKMKKNAESALCKLISEEMGVVTDGFKFMRRGIVGSFKDELTPELIGKIDKWSEECLAQYGIKEQDIFGKL